MNNHINEVNKMTFAELRNELANCSDPVKQYIIRNLMMLRYKQHLENKELERNLKKKYQKSQIKKIKRKLEKKYRNKSVNNPLTNSDFIEPEETREEEDDNTNNNNNMYNGTKINEYIKDRTNNNLMNRLHNDIEINKMKDDNIYKSSKSNKKNNNDFVSPFSNDGSDDKYASFDNAFKI
ncbi:MAG: hypothetical protein Barrevirus4_24 [Barrevirus sp.]|uniref:Uncharacterized protein n=1 Tax=Barrevirus sp. TaxID=2487763 RepID=A0A3G4ZPW4_9VIRU|nr:MAG: hypothetical protein Barrevirus4_24 [Barrevirus sp.]